MYDFFFFIRGPDLLFYQIDLVIQIMLLQKIAKLCCVTAGTLSCREDDQVRSHHPDHIIPARLHKLMNSIGKFCL